MQHSSALSREQLTVISAAAGAKPNQAGVAPVIYCLTGKEVRQRSEGFLEDSVRLRVVFGLNLGRWLE